MALTLGRSPPCDQLVKMMVSNATITVAAEGPKKRTAEKTKASETEILALIEGSFMLNEPVRMVNPASHSHSFPIGRITTLYADDAIT